MRVSELRKGMMLRPKKGCRFRVWRGNSYGNNLFYQQLECHKRTSPHQDVGTAPIIYIGEVAKKNSEHSYESRRSVFVTVVGQQMLVAPEAWRNMEAVSDAN